MSGSSYDPNSLGISRDADDAGYDDNNANAKYLPLLKLFAATSKPVQRGQALPGTFGAAIGKDKIHKFGPSVDVLAYASKRMAIDMSVPGAPSRSYDKNSELFKRIVAKSDAGNNSKCQYGTVFLLFERTTGLFLEFFCGNPSSRIEIPVISTFLPISADDIARRKAAHQDVSGQEPSWAKPFTITAQLVEKPTMSFHVPVATACKVPFANEPVLEEIQQRAIKFLTADAGPVEVTGVTRQAR